jgi:uncharacterized protein DUF5994
VIKVQSPRLVIAARPSLRDHLHGAWWPHTTDIDTELAPMLIAVASRFHAVLGVMLNRDEWPSGQSAGRPSRAGATKISWYGLPESHLVVLHCSSYRRIALLVVPPDTPEQLAVTATLIASTPGNALTAGQALAKASSQAN